MYLTRVKGKTVHCLDCSVRPRTITFDPTEYRFKLALLKNNYEMLYIICTSTLLGQSIIVYLQQKGFDEVCSTLKWFSDFMLIWYFFQRAELQAHTQRSLAPAFRVVVPEGPHTQHVRPSSMVIRPLRAAPAPAPSQSAPKSAPVPAPTPVGTQAPQPAGFEHILNHFLGAGGPVAPTQTNQAGVDVDLQQLLNMFLGAGAPTSAPAQPQVQKLVPFIWRRADANHIRFFQADPSNSASAFKPAPAANKSALQGARARRSHPDVACRVSAPALADHDREQE
jgi:hypothetical protein